jgi:hypothetical protein
MQRRYIGAWFQRVRDRKTTPPKLPFFEIFLLIIVRGSFEILRLDICIKNFPLLALARGKL